MNARDFAASLCLAGGVIVTLAATALPCRAAARAHVRAAQSEQDVLTYHNDAGRTGWNANETVLTTSNVNASSFGMLATTPLDGRVDTQPLVVTQQPIDGQGVHDVVYLATEHDTLYALDAATGAVLYSRSFGTPVPDGFKSGDDNVYPEMGVLGTPVIDRNLNALFLVADTFYGSYDTFTLHAIALNNGSDLVAPVIIQAALQLKGGSTWSFNSQFQLQRAGLLEANSSIYVTFGSNGDLNPDISRGTIARFDAATLAPQAAAITNTLVENSYVWYLTSIWQSGYAIASDAVGNVYFSTGNSNPWVPTYKKKYNHPEGVIKLSGDLSTLLGNFTPSDYFDLDQADADLGSGGTLVLPPQSGAYPNLVAAGGKDGRTFLLDGNNLGGFKKNKNNVLATVNQGNCWCGPAYFVGSDGAPRLVTGGSDGVTDYRLVTSASAKPQLFQETTTGSGPADGLPDYGGTIPTISSNGTTAGTAIAWFIQRPQTSSDYEPGTPITLYAFDAMHLGHQLFSSLAGTWRHAINSNANIVPTVANGRVYVASEQQLQIFGLFSQNKVRR